MISSLLLIPTLASLAFAPANSSTEPPPAGLSQDAQAGSTEEAPAVVGVDPVQVPFVTPPDQAPPVEGGVFTRFYHSDGTLAREGYLKDGARVGVWKTWYENGQRALHGTYSDYKRVGSWVIYAEDGKSRTEATYDDQGERHGQWRTLFRGEKAAGELRSITSYKHGRKHGPQVRYARNGNLLALVEFKNGRKHGRNLKYSRGGKHPSESGCYSDGLQEGPWKLYHPDGVLQAEGSFVAGKRIGEWVQYYANGRRESVGGFESGLAEGAWQGYYKQGERRYLGTFKRGELVGDYVEWWPSGDKKGEGRFLAGKYDGPWTFWDREGREDPSKTGTYKDGDLVR